MDIAVVSKYSLEFNVCAFESIGGALVVTTYNEKPYQEPYEAVVAHSRAMLSCPQKEWFVVSKPKQVGRNSITAA